MHKFVAIMRVAISALIMIALVATLTDTSGLVPENFWELATYYTFQTNIILAVVLMVLTWHSMRRTTPSVWLEYGRAFCAVNLTVVAIIYWAMIFPEGFQDGAQLAFVMIVSHVITPLYLSIEYLLVGTRDPLPLSRLWAICVYAGIWTVATVARSAGGQWVPYDHLDPAQGYGAVFSVVMIHTGILLALAVAAMRIRRFRIIAEPAGLSVKDELASKRQRVSEPSMVRR